MFGSHILYKIRTRARVMSPLFVESSLQSKSALVYLTNSASRAWCNELLNAKIFIFLPNFHQHPPFCGDNILTEKRQKYAFYVYQSRFPLSYFATEKLKYLFFCAVGERSNRSIHVHLVFDT